MLLDHNIRLIVVVIDEHSHLLFWVSLTDRVVTTTPADTSLRLSLMIPVVIKVYHSDILLHESLLRCLIILH